ncbi:hypothetical protein N9V25_03230 [Flavobacteriaceae bacterium]|nr:hypothetical protein [Flavobacteriaceae bacterium]
MKFQIVKPFFFEEDPVLGEIKHIRIKALSDIQKGEEITIKYVINKLENPNWEHDYEITQ